MPAVICLGDVMTDIVARLPGPLAAGSDTPAPIEFLGGGSAANTACWLAAAGVPAVLVGRVGADERGRVAHALLRQAGVRPAITIDPWRSTGTCIVLVDDTGERTMVPDAGANAGLEIGDIPAELFVENNHLHISGYTLMNDEARAAAQAAMRLATERGLSVSVDAASEALIRTIGAGRFLSWLSPGVLLFANASEARVLTGHEDPMNAAQILSIHCGQSIVKCGAAGAIWAHNGWASVVPTTALEVVDSTGAGDAFAAGFLAAWLGGIEPLLATRLAHTYAARAVTQVGGRPHPPP